MGWTTVIQLDHDRASEILDDPKGFMQVITNQLVTGGNTAERIPGGEIVASFHSHRNRQLQEWWWKCKERLNDILHH